ncbi:hypothetical protein MYX07_00405 [Patescibacteria group bacterium AH-259-L07]|nr:hypothetical protein [Patescibacteria group bacterium AH-259-L07]
MPHEEEQTKSEEEPFGDLDLPKHIHEHKLIEKILPHFTEVMGGSWNVGTINTWEVKDISAFVPKGTLYADILIDNTVSALVVAGVREVGSSLDRFRNLAASHGIMIMTVKVNVDLKIEHYAGATAVDFWVVGYYL